jgi:UDP-N-acetylglucosamine 4,6-dehydratase/5-epimerase
MFQGSHGGSMDLSVANVFVTGGAGFLGNAIAKRRKKEGWKGKLTVYSTDEHKHARMRILYPDINYVCGDIRNETTLYNAMVGHDVVIHAAAVKVIPVSEYNSVDTFDVNVLGSQVVCTCALKANIQEAMFISTDKACHPANAYGCSKMMMEKLVQEYARLGMKTNFHLIRYGNVLESTSSVIEIWKKSIQRGEPIQVTEPTMTRFWLSPNQAVIYILKAFDIEPGSIYIPKVFGLSIGNLAEYTVMNQPENVTPSDVHIEKIPLRPGEKMHEELLALEECPRAFDSNPTNDNVKIGDDFFMLLPSTTVINFKRMTHIPEPYFSNTADQLNKQHLLRILADD